MGGVWNTTQRAELTERMKRLRATNTQQDNSTLSSMDSMEEQEMTHLSTQQDNSTLSTMDSMDEQEMTHLRQQLIEMTRQLQQKEQELERNAETIQQNEATIRRKYQEQQRNAETIQQNDAAIQRKEQELERNTQTIKQKDSTIQRNEHLRLTMATQLQQKDSAIQSKDQQLAQKEATIQRSAQALRQNEATIHQLQSDIREKYLQIRQKNDVIQRHEGTITQQRRVITGYRDNPSWLIERDEITVTGEVLGRGGWGEVKVGVFRGTRVAVKTLYEVIVNDYYLQLFSREMDLASRIRHPNLLQFIGATKVGQLMIITELMPTSLRSELGKHSLLRCQVISIATDVVSALNYLHSFRPRPILHRDVSSANVLLEPSVGNSWKGKLSDYGSVNLMDNISTSNPGNPVYSAPEASTPRLHSAAMDIYSFGILLTEMATCQFPSPEAHEREGSIQDIKWSSVKELVIQCTSTDPSLRPPTDTVLTLLRDMI